MENVQLIRVLLHEAAEDITPSPSFAANVVRAAVADSSDSLTGYLSRPWGWAQRLIGCRAVGAVAASVAVITLVLSVSILLQRSLESQVVTVPRLLSGRLISVTVSPTEGGGITARKHERGYCRVISERGGRVR
jgi:hypothetical protein